MHIHDGVTYHPDHDDCPWKKLDEFEIVSVSRIATPEELVLHHKLLKRKLRKERKGSVAE